VLTGTAKASGIVGSAFRYQIVASNSPASYGATGLAPGLTLNSASGVISGTLTTAGVFNGTLRATNATGTGTAPLEITALIPAPVLTGTAKASGIVGSAFRYQIVASNSPASYGATGLAPGLTLNPASGVISGTLTTAGVFAGTVSATNATGTGTAPLEITALIPAPVLTGTFRASGVYGSSFAYQISATNAPVGFSAAGLPQGLVLNAQSGLISGTLAQSGTFAIVLGATNSAGSGSASLLLSVAQIPPVLTNLQKATGVVGSGFRFHLAALNEPSTYAASGLPSGMAINALTGEIFGTPAEKGIYRVTLSSSNSGGTGTAPWLLTVYPQAPQLVLGGTSLAATVGVPFQYTLPVQSGPAEFAATGLPSGLALNSQTGRISGSPTAVGSYSVEAVAYNEGGVSSGTLTIKVVPPAPIVGGTLAVLAKATVPFRYRIVASNSPTRFGATGLSEWLSLDEANGVFSGVPKTAGTFPIQLEVANEGGTGRATLVLTVTTLPVPPLISSVLAVSGTVGQPFGYQILASNAPSRFAATGLPPGLAVDPLRGLISGIPTLVGETQVALSAENEGGTGAGTLVLRVLPRAPEVTVEKAALAAVGASFRYQIVATNQPGAYTATGLPPGLVLNGSTGLISGKALEVGTYAVTLRATNAGGAGSALWTVGVLPAAPVLNVGSLLAKAGVPFSYAIAAENTPEQFSARGLPGWLVLDTRTGVLAGTPPGPGATEVTLSASNAGGTGTASVALVVTAVGPALTQQPARTVTIPWGTSVTLSAQASGNPAPSYRWKRNGVVLPAETGPTLVLGYGAPAKNVYTVEASNAAGSVESSPAEVETLAFTVGRPVLSVPGVAQARGLIAGRGFVLSGTVEGVDSAAASHRWYRNGVALKGAASAQYIRGFAEPGDAGEYVLEVTVGGVRAMGPSYVLEQLTPVVKVNPPGLNMLEGGTAVFSASLANGSLYAGESVDFVWKSKGVEIGRGATLTLPNLSAGAGGVYDVEAVHPVYGTGAARAALEVSRLNILHQPVGGTVLAGQTVELRVGVASAGVGALQYQWRRNGAAVAGATGAQYRFVQDAAELSAYYDVEVSGVVAGKKVVVLSAPATVSLLEAVELDTALFAQQARRLPLGQPLELNVRVAKGTAPYTFQWYRFNGTQAVALADGVLGGTLVAGANSARLVLTSGEGQSAAGSYKVRVSNGESAAVNGLVARTQVETSAVTVAPILAPVARMELVQSPAGDVDPGTNVLLGLRGLSEPEAALLRFQWRRNGQFIAGATASTYRLTVGTSAQTGVYDVVVSNESGRAVSASVNVALKQAPAELLRGLQDATVLEGQRFDWTGFAATGDSLVYDWSRKLGVLGGSALGGTLRFAAASLADAGSYTVSASNRFGKVSGTAMLRVLQRAEITVQPALAEALNPGEKLTLKGQARGGDPGLTGGGLQYQWLRNGIAVPGAVGATFQLPSVSVADDGARFALRVNVQDAANRRVLHSVTSDSAVLVVRRQVELLAQPQSLSVDLNGKARFSVVATGTGLEYQWRKDGVLVAGATGAALTLDALESSAGVYDAVVKNSVNTVTSAGATLSVRVPARIVTHPVGKTVNPMGTAKFSVEAAGTAPLRYQWRRNGVALSDTAKLTGTDTPQLTVLQLAAGDLGDYDVVVANGIGSPQLSATAVLGVSEAAAFSLQPVPAAARVGQPARFAVKVQGLAAGKGQRLQWRLNGTAIPGANGSEYAIPLARLSDAGDYDVVATSGATQLTSDSARLQVFEDVRLVRVPQPATSLLPESEAFPQATVELHATAAGGGALRNWQWFRDGVLVSSFTGTGDAASLDVEANDVRALYKVSVSSEVVAGGAVLSAGTATSAEVPVQLLGRVKFKAQPQATTADAGGAASFTVAAEGGGVLAYTWERERAGRWSPIPGATGPVLSLTGLRVSDTGWYRVSVANARGTETSGAAQLNVREVDVIVRQPLADASGSRSVNPGDTAVLEVGAVGADLSYQWRKNGVALTSASALSPRLVLDAVTASDVGVYDVEVKHAYGSSVSRSVRVLVNVPAAITTQPADASVLGGAAATLVVRATGTEPLAYQWRRNGEAVGGGTSSALITREAGIYDVVVENTAGRAVSRAVTVSVPMPVLIVQQPVSQAVAAGRRVEFKVVATGSPGTATGALSYQWRKDGVALAELGGSVEGVRTDTLLLPAVDSGSGGAYDVVVANDLNAVAAIPATLLIHTAPVFVKSPEPLALNPGDSALLSAAVRGPGPFTYTWYRRTLDSTGRIGAVRLSETSQNLVLERFGVDSQPGDYWVVAANQYGETRSAEARVSQLEMLKMLEIAEAAGGLAQAAAGAPASFTAVAARNVSATRGARLPLAYTGMIQPQLGVSLEYQWRFNGVSLADGLSLSGTRTQTLVFENVQDSDAGVYDLQITAYSGGVQKSQITTRTTVLKVLQPPVVNGLVDLLARPGQTVTFAPVVQSGGGTLRYRWFFKGQPLADRTGATLTLLSVGAAQIGEYEFEVTDSYGTTRARVSLSVASPLVVAPLPEQLTPQPRSQVQLEARATAAAADGTLRYQWRFNGVHIRGAVRSSLVLPAVLASQAGQYDVVVSNSRERVVSNICTLRLEEPYRIVTQPKALSVVNPGLPVELSVVVGPQGGATYQWIRGIGRASVVLPEQKGATLRIASATEKDEGIYLCVVTTPQGRLSSTLARVMVNNPVTITQQPLGRVATPGTAVSFVAKATGTGPLVYQWQRNGEPVAGANTAELTLAKVSALDSGDYRLLVSNPVSQAGVLSDVARLSVSVPATVTAEPQDVRVLQGGSVTLSVGAVGDGTLRYQWRRNGVDLLNATEPVLTRSNVSVQDTGYFECVVSNRLGTLEIGSSVSRRALVQVCERVALVAQPVSRSVATTGTVNRGASFRVVAAGTGPLSYTWTKLGNGKEADRTLEVLGDTLSLGQAGAADLGSYKVRVSGPLGDFVESGVFELTAADASPGDAFARQPEAVNGIEGRPVFLDAVAGAGYKITKWLRIGYDSARGVETTTELAADAATGRLVFASARLADTGCYRAVAQSAAGQTQVLSAPVLLYVNLADPLYKAGFRSVASNLTQLEVQQTVLANEGDTTAFSLYPVGEGLRFQWSRDGGGLPASARGAENAVLSLRGVQPGDAGTYRVSVSVPDGSGGFVKVDGVPWRLVVRALPRVVAPPVSQTLLPGQQAVFSVAAEVTGDTRFQWFFRASGAAFWVPVPGSVAVEAGGETARTSQNLVYIKGVQSVDGGEYRVDLSNAAGTVSSSSAVLTVYQPATSSLVLEGAPANPGGRVTLKAVTTGALVEPSQYVFQRQQLRTGRWEILSTQEAPVLVLNAVGQDEDTNYRVRVYGKTNGAVESAAVRLVVKDPVGFAVARTSVSALARLKGEGVTLSVGATGSDVAYQWYFRGARGGDWTALAGATGATLQIESAQFSNTGSYGVVLSNSFSKAPEDGTPREVARLSVSGPPEAVLSSSADVHVVEGGSLVLRARVTDSGQGLVQYQWRRNGMALPGASGSVVVAGPQGAALPDYAKSGLGAGDAGQYDLLVSNVSGAWVSGSVRVLVNLKPVIATQPQSVLASEGGTAVFRVESFGRAQTGYQWYRKNVGGVFTPVEGATQAALNLKTLAVADHGAQFRVDVSNEYATVSSDVARLSVAPLGALRVTVDPALSGGTLGALRSGQDGLVLSATAEDSGGVQTATYHWRRDGVVVYTGTTTAVGVQFPLPYRLPKVSNESDGVYDVVVDNGAAFAVSKGLALRLDPRIEQVDVPAAANPGDGLRLRVAVRESASGAAYSYQWLRNGQALSDGPLYSGARGAELSITAVPASEDWQREQRFNVRVTNAAGVSFESGERVLTVTAPAKISAQPVSVALLQGEPLKLEVLASGGGTLRYQWLKDGAELAGANSATLVTAAAGLGDAGLYQVRVSNGAGSVLSSLVQVQVTEKLGVTLTGTASVPLGGSVNLVAEAIGKGPFRYRWTRNGGVLAGVSGEQVRVLSAVPGDAGVYAVTVQRMDGERVLESATSEPLVLRVREVPVVLVAPVSRIVADKAGTAVSFAVVVHSEKPVTYRWSKDGVALSGASASLPTLRLGAAGWAEAGRYSVTVSNLSEANPEGGSVEASATLRVLPAGSEVSVPTAGSSGTGVAHTSWWAYWTEAVAADAQYNRNGYWLLERRKVEVGGITTVLAGRAVWVWGLPNHPTAPLTSEEWAAEEQVVQDAVASERGEFSVLADRAPKGGYAVSGRVEEVGEAAAYGAPESLRGGYSLESEPLEVSLAWDPQQVLQFGAAGSPATLRGVIESLKASLLLELGNISGE
jgi:hypothetical protein